MAICEYCGSTIPDGTKFCTNCGAALPVEAPIQEPYTPPQQTQQPYGNYQQPTYEYPVDASYDPNDTGSIGWAILGFVIPIVGLILFLIWRTSRPKSAKMAGIGALVGVVLNMCYVVFF